jgi:hypothetical protein
MIHEEKMIHEDPPLVVDRCGASRRFAITGAGARNHLL